MKRVLLLLSLSFAVLAGATEIPEKGWEYERLDDDHVMIHNADQSRHAAAIDPDTEGDIAVPSTLRSMQVVSIGEKAFYNCSKITSVIIPEGVTNIADYAFWYCTSLTNVVFPTSLKSIGANAFQGCSKLSAANFTGASLTIGTHAFRDCSSVRELSFSGDLISIGDHAFSGCTGLLDVSFDTKSVSVGKCSFSIYSTYSTIHSQACTALTNLSICATDASLATVSFSGCTALRTVEVSAQSLSVGERAFSKYNYYSYYWTSPCSSLDSLIVKVDTMTVGTSAFSECSLLAQLDVSSSNLTVGASSFSSCSSLTNAVLTGSECATIGESAFSSCSKLQSIELPTALRDVATNAFYTCTSLGKISFTTNLIHISYRAFDTCTSLKSVELPEGLTGIDAQAFYGCTSLTNLVFPQSLASVGNRAFERCENLGDVMFSEGDTNLIAASAVSVGERAFYQCDSLTNVVLSQAVSSLGSRAFSQCGSLAVINLPTNFTDLAESAFEDCAALPSIDLPVTLESIGNAAFFGCTNLTSFLIPTQNVVTIGAKAFKNTKYWNEYPNDLVVNNGYILGFKNNPVDVVLPDDCKAIPVAMFEGMTTLKSVTIPDSVTEIGSRAFNGCSGITNIAFNSVTTIGNSAFEGCSSLWGVTLSDCLTAIPGNCFKDCTALLSVFIPGTVASIGEYAFYNCGSLTTVTGGAGVTQVGDYAFAQCPNLQTFEFPNDVAYGDHVYQGCTWTEHVLFPAVGTLKDEYPTSYMNITSVVFSSNMSIITNGACSGCSSLAYIRIPDGVTSIGDSAFAGCSSLTSVVMSASVSTVATNSFAGCGAIVSATVTGGQAMKDLFPDSYANLTHVALADGVTSLCAHFMEGCALVVSIEIPSSVESIGSSAFAHCVRLSSLKLPSQVASIEENAFAGCTALGAIDLPEGVTTIGEQAFDGCSALSALTMSASVTTVQSNAFRGCTSLTKLVVSGQFPLASAFPETYSALTDVGLATNATSLCADLFSNCVALAAVEIPWRVTTIGARAFYGCTGLTDLVIPELVSEIGDSAFARCRGLTSVGYLCEKPDSVAENIYAGTYGSLFSKVLVQHESWQTETNCAGATVLPDTWCDRSIVWWGAIQAQLATVQFAYNTNYGGGTNLYYLANAGREILELPNFPDHPFNTNLVCLGWYTASVGGTKVKATLPVAGSVTYYAHWGTREEAAAEEEREKEEAEEQDEDSEEDPEEDESAADLCQVNPDDDVAAISLFLPAEMTTGEEMSDETVDVSDSTTIRTVKVTGLPTGLKFTAKDVYATGSKTDVAHEAYSIYGTPSKSGVYAVVATVTTSGGKTTSCSQTVVVRKDGELFVKAEVVLVNDAIETIASTEIPGKVTGMGVYAAGKKVTLRATANKGYVFNGWYDESGTLLSGLSSYAFTMGEFDFEPVAAFVTASDDKESVSATVNGMSFSGQDDGTFQAIETNAIVGAYVEWPVAARALSATTVKVSGLPTGLRFAASPVVTKTTTGTGTARKTTVVTNVPANTIYGTLTAASRTSKGVVVPSKVVVTVTTAGRNTRTFSINFTVLPLPASCAGTFSGYALVEANTNNVPSAADETGWLSLPCPFTATVDAKGALSGSITAIGKRISFKAARYAAYDASVSNLIYDVAIPLKTIDRTWIETLTLSLAIANGEATLVSPTASSPHLAVTAVDALRNAAKDSGYGDLAKPYKGTCVATFDTLMPDGVTRGFVTVALTVDAKGGVKAAGTFVDATTFSASATLALEPDGRSATVLIPATGRPFGSGGALFAFSFAKDDAGAVTLAALSDEEGPRSCAAKYVLKTKSTPTTYASYVLLEDAAYAYRANDWIGPSLETTDLLSVSYEDGSETIEALYAFTSKNGVVTGVGRTTNRAKLALRINAKTGLFTGTSGKTKVFGAFYPAVGDEASVAGCGSAVFATGGVAPVSVEAVSAP